MRYLKITAILLALALLAGLLPAALAAETPSTDTYCNRSLTGQHNWGEWTTAKKATCTQTGMRTRTCGRCGYTQTETIRKTSHSWGKWQTTKEATCEKHGEQTRKCSVCGGIETRETDRKAHTWGEWTVVTEPTDFSMGTRSHVCEVCGREKTEDFYPDPTYKRGDKGDGVKALQEKLNAAGYDCGKVDGDFGRKTEAAVKAIEEAHGVIADGIAWPGVQKWLGLLSRPVLRNLPVDAKGLVLDIEQVSPVKELYAPGEEVRFKWTLGNHTLEPIEYVSLIQSIFPECFDPESSLYRTNCNYFEGENTDLVPFDFDKEATLLAPFGAYIGGEFSWPMLPGFGLNDIVMLRFAALGITSVDGVKQEIMSNVISMEFPLDPSAPMEEEEDEEEEKLELVEGAGIRLKVLSVEDSHYLEGDHVKAKLRLTNIDTTDLYSLWLSIPGDDMIEVEGWDQGSAHGSQQYDNKLKSGESVDITYTMVISEKTAGWKDRTVDARARLYAQPEEPVWASATIPIPVKPSKVTIVSGGSSVNINSNDQDALVLTPSETMPLSGLSFIGGDEIKLDFTLRNASPHAFLETPRLIYQYCKREGAMTTEFSGDVVLLDKQMQAKAGGQNGETAYSLSLPALGDGEGQGEYILRLRVRADAKWNNGFVGQLESNEIRVKYRYTETRQSENIELTCEIESSQPYYVVGDKVSVAMSVRNNAKLPLTYRSIEALDGSAWEIKPLDPAQSKTLQSGEVYNVIATHTLTEAEAKDSLSYSFQAVGAAYGKPLVVQSNIEEVAVMGAVQEAPQLLRLTMEGHSINTEWGVFWPDLLLYNYLFVDLTHYETYRCDENGVAEYRIIEGGGIMHRSGEKTGFPLGVNSGLSYWVAVGWADSSHPVISNILEIEAPEMEFEQPELSLDADLLNPKDDPEATWQDGELVTIRLNASFDGEEVSSYIMCWCTAFNEDADLDIASVIQDSTILEDELDFFLDASEQKDGVCTITFHAGAFDENGELCSSVPVTLTFPME